MTLNKRTKILSTSDLIENGVYKNELAYEQARVLIDVFAELKATRNVCAEKFNQGPGVDEISPKIHAELIVEWLDKSMDMIEKCHEKAIGKYS